MVKRNLDSNKYSNRTCADGTSVKPGYVLVPYWLDGKYKLPASVTKNCTTYHYAGMKFHICFIQCKEEDFETYMEAYNEEIKAFLRTKRTGRCVIGHKPNGEPICCPKANLCTGCKNQHDPEVERYNPYKNILQPLSLDFCYENEDFDIADTNALSPEDLVLSEYDLSVQEQYELAIAYFSKVNPRYAKIYELGIQGTDIDDICTAIGLKQSRGREEINNAYNALCDFLNLGCYKIKPKKRK